MEKRRNCSSFPQYFQYISNFKSPITYIFVQCGCSNYVFLNSANLTCRGTDISFPQYFQYISNFKSPITYIFFKCGCSNYFFLNSASLICRGTDISRFEITRVDCICLVRIGVLCHNNESSERHTHIHEHDDEAKQNENFTLGPDATLNTETQKKFGSHKGSQLSQCIKAKT